MERTIDLNGHEVKLRTGGGILRRYRQWIGRDIMSDMNYISQTIETMGKDDFLPIPVLEKFEDIAYTMARYADEANEVRTVPDTADEWLEGFETFDIYLAFPIIIKMWKIDQLTTVEPKKNSEQPPGT